MKNKKEISAWEKVEIARNPKRKRNVTHKNNNNGSKCWERPGAAKI